MNVPSCHENDAQPLLHNERHVLDYTVMNKTLHILLLGLIVLAFAAPTASHAQRVKKTYTNSVTTTTNSPIVATSPP